MPATPGFRMPSGGVNLYCDKCYKEKMEGYEELISLDISKKDEKELYAKVLEKIKKALEKEDEKIIIIKEKKGYRIKYKHKTN